MDTEIVSRVHIGGTGNNGMSTCRQLARNAYALLKEQDAIIKGEMS